jgi:L-2-hydroxyglutarate oxidase LhgO
VGADVVVIGAGVVGCAVASRLSRRGRTVVLLEREAREGRGTTSRSSGVVHAGLYYPPGSLKARTCRAGNEALFAWASSHGVEHRRVGKLVLAIENDEIAQLEALLENAHGCGAAECELVDAAEVRRREPALPPHPAAIWSPRTGIVDAIGLTRSLLVDAERHGAVAAFSARVDAIERTSAGFRVLGSRGELEAEVIVNAAGLFADELAAPLGLDKPHHPCRGDYFRLRAATRYHHLLYPVKSEARAGLGIHLTIEIDGGYRLGPDVEWVEGKSDFGAREHKHPRFLAAARRLLGTVRGSDLTYDGCGIRPRLGGPDAGASDFVVEQRPAGCFHLLGIESPGLTAALPLAALIEAEVCG